jgi:hypothetical protein
MKAYIIDIQHSIVIRIFGSSLSCNRVHARMETSSGRPNIVVTFSVEIFQNFQAEDV